MGDHIDQQRFRVARVTCLILAAIFTLWTASDLVLILAVPVARGVRAGFGLATGAGAVGFWVVWWLSGRAVGGHISRRR